MYDRYDKEENQGIKMETFDCGSTSKSFYSVKDLADAMHCTRGYIYKKIASGDIVARRVWPSNRWLISEEEVERWVKRTKASVGLY